MIRRGSQKPSKRQSIALQVRSAFPSLGSSGSIEKAADKAFLRMNMTRTRDRNGVLFFVVPARRKFVVLGDRGIHEKVGQEFWDRVVAVVSDKFREGDFTEGLVRGIEEVGEQLATHFPHEADDKNELSDKIDFGGI